MKEKLTKNIGWKVGGLLLALALWFHLATEKVYEKKFDATVKITGLPTHLKVERVDPHKISVSFTGTGKQLLRLALLGEAKVRLSLSNIKNPGEYEIPIDLSDLYEMDISAFKRVSFVSGNRLKVFVKEKT